MSKVLVAPKPPWELEDVSRSTYFRRRRKEREQREANLMQAMPSVLGLDEPADDYQRGVRDAVVSFAAEREAAMKASALALEATVQRVLIEEFMFQYVHHTLPRCLSTNVMEAIYKTLREAGYGK